MEKWREVEGGVMKGESEREKARAGDGGLKVREGRSRIK